MKAIAVHESPRKSRIRPPRETRQRFALARGTWRSFDRVELTDSIRGGGEGKFGSCQTVTEGYFGTGQLILRSALKSKVWPLSSATNAKCLYVIVLNALILQFKTRIASWCIETRQTSLTFLERMRILFKSVGCVRAGPMPVRRAGRGFLNFPGCNALRGER